MSWIEVSLDATPEAVDWVNTLLATTDYRGNVQITNYNADPGGSRQQDFNDRSHDRSTAPPAWAFTIRFYLPDQGTASAQIAAIERLLSPLHRTNMTTLLQITVLAEQPEPIDLPAEHQIGQSFVVQTDATAGEAGGTGEALPARQILLRLATARAFGSGLHPTTIASLQLLERHVLPGMNGLDFGCGSGILAVAMAKLGATVLAIDNDPVAVAAAQDTVRRNGAESEVTVAQGSLGPGSDLGHWMGGKLTDPVAAIEANARFDLIVANIPAPIHLALVQSFRQALRPSGLLIVAGFTTDYADEMPAALAAVGLTLIDRAQLDDWLALVGQLTAASQ